MSVVTLPVSPTFLVAEDIASTSAPIAYCGSFSLLEYNQICKALGQSSWGKWGLMVFSAGALVIAGVATYRYAVPVIGDSRPPIPFSSLMYLWGACLLYFFLGPGLVWLARRKDLANLAQQRGPFEPVSGEISAAGVMVRGSDRVDAYSWEEFQRYRETTSLIALFKCNDESPVLLAESRFASSEDWVQVKTLVASQFPSSQSRCVSCSNRD